MDAAQERALQAGSFARYLRGNVAAAQTLGVRATNRGLTARARGAGRLWIEISRENLLPAVPRRKPAAEP